MERLADAFGRMPPRRRLLMGAGLASFIGGLLLLSAGFVLLSSGDDGPSEGPAVVDLGQVDLNKLDSVATATAAPTVAALGDQPYRMVIEKLGVNAPVDTYGLDAQAVPEVPTGANAKEIVAWYDFSAHPGAGSNAVFAGHVTWNGPAVFYKLTQIAKGDIIKLQSADGKELVYNVASIFSVDPNDPDSLKVMRGTDRDMLTLITCDGTFTDTNDPVFGGEYNKRLIVRAELAASVGAPAAGG